MKILLDTHIWLHYLAGNTNLPKELIKIIEDKNTECLLSPISIWEASILVEKKKIKIKGSFDKWIETALKLFPITEASITSAIIISIAKLKFKHKDPADQIIAATSKTYNVPLLTMDKELKKLKWLNTIS